MPGKTLVVSDTTDLAAYMHVNGKNTSINSRFFMDMSKGELMNYAARVLSSKEFKTIVFETHVDQYACPTQRLKEYVDISHSAARGKMQT